MQRLNKKIILEYYEDEPKEEIERVAVEDEPELSEQEKRSFILSTLNGLSNQMTSVFDTMTGTLNMLDLDRTMSQDNIDLLNGIYEDISLILGKIQQGIKDNSPENIQNSIDDGQTAAQETIAA